MEQMLTVTLDSPDTVWTLGLEPLGVRVAPCAQPVPVSWLSSTGEGPMLVVDVRGAASWTITESGIQWDFLTDVRFVAGARTRAATPTRDLPPDVFEILVRGWMAVLRADYRQRHRDDLGGVTLSPSAR